MEAYYRILNLRPGATYSELKDAFRRQVKLYHPDLHPSKRKWAEKRLRVIVEAYRSLRSWMELTGRVRQPERRLNKKPEDFFTSQVRLVFELLLNGCGEEALELYEKLMNGRPVVAMLPVLGLKDYLDCVFLLAEEYERQEKLHQAVTLYEEVYEEEKEEPRVRYFFDELVERLKKLYCQKLPKECEARDAIRYYSSAMKLGLDRRELAVLHRRMAECALRIGEIENAREWLNTAVKLRPDVDASGRLEEQIKQKECG